jgi:serine phosphatase RsbU (regulator of sigma subunit)
MATVLITDRSGNRTTMPLERDKRYTIGRADGNAITLSDPSVSRQHAEIFLEGDAWSLRDCGSSNGTFLDGRRVETPTRLVAGARIAIGNHALQFEPAAATKDKVSFSDRPLSSGGTVFVSADDLRAETDPEKARSASANLESIRRRLDVVERANLELLGHEPMGVLLPKILDLVFEAVNPERAALLLREGGELVCRAFRGSTQQGEMSISRTVARTVIDQRVSVLTADAQHDARFADGASIAIQGIQAVMAVPLWNNKEVIGLIYADSRLASTRFSEEDLKVLTMLANVAAIQIENASLFEAQLERRRLEEEARAAADIQRRLLPSCSPDIPGYRFDGHNTPCREVGGDYFDCLPLDDARHGIVLADVAGKGMGAALLMATFQATFHAAVSTGSAASSVLDQLGRAVSRSAPSNRFVTVFLVELDRAAHRLICVNAGHAPLPLVVRVKGEMEPVDSVGPPLGILAGFPYRTRELDLRPGDFLFACSDGVTDLESPQGEQFGDERLAAVLRSQAGRPISEVRQALQESLAAHADSTRQPDDLTFVLLQRV